MGEKITAVFFMDLTILSKPINWQSILLKKVLHMFVSCHQKSFVTKEET